MSNSLFNNVYGRCPLGHNSVASGATGDHLSTHEIGSNEDVPLLWSNYHQKYICKMCLDKVSDIKENERRSERYRREEEIRASLGYVQA